MNDIVVSVDLRPSFGPVRNQGPRPTCMAFAASDVHAGLRSGWTPLSCEFAFYHAQRRVGRPPNKGALLSAMLDTLREDGQPAEMGCPIWRRRQMIRPPGRRPQPSGRCSAATARKRPHQSMTLSASWKPGGR